MSQQAESSIFSHRKISRPYFGIFKTLAGSDFLATSTKDVTFDIMADLTNNHNLQFSVTEKSQ